MSNHATTKRREAARELAAMMVPMRSWARPGVVPPENEARARVESMLLALTALDGDHARAEGERIVVAEGIYSDDKGAVLVDGSLCVYLTASIAAQVRHLDGQRVRVVIEPISDYGGRG